MADNHLPKVSIMIPTYNQEGSIGKAIESALSQDYPNLEVIVSDDCSTDRTSEIAAQYLADKRLKCHKNDPNLGRTGNYRKSLYERVSGEWAINIDGDDYLYGPHVISCMINELLLHIDDRIVAVMGPHLIAHADISKSIRSPRTFKSGIFEGTDLLLNWHRINFGHLATLYKVSIARKLGYYRLNTISSDWESALRLIVGNSVIVVDGIVGVWNIHNENISGTMGIINAIEDYSYIDETYKYAMTQRVERTALDIWYRRMIRLHTRAIWISNIKNIDKVRRLVPHVARLYPFALLEMLRPKSLIINGLKSFPKIYARAKTLYWKLKYSPSACGRSNL